MKITNNESTMEMEQNIETGKKKVQKKKRCSGLIASSAAVESRYQRFRNIEMGKMPGNHERST